MINTKKKKIIKSYLYFFFMINDFLCRNKEIVFKFFKILQRDSKYTPRCFT